MADPTQRDFAALFASLASIGRNPRTGGLNRFAWTDEDAAARDWFRAEARRRGLEVETDGNGNLWAWWGDGFDGAVATGSHLDTVPEGGAYDGALGVVCGLLAVDALRSRGARLSRPLAVVAFADEEGARFGAPTFGSRMMTGDLDQAVLDRRDAAGVTLGDAARARGVSPVGADPGRLSRLAAFVEVHVEQGRGLADMGQPLATATTIWPHGRWRLTLTGAADHAGTARLEDRRDASLALAGLITTARQQAVRLGAVATVGRIEVRPNGTNVVPAEITAWLDARAPTEDRLDDLVHAIGADVERQGAEVGVAMTAECESRSRAVTFSADLRERIDAVLARVSGEPVSLPTAAGHDAGILAPHLPTAMVFVRNPTGASHSPAESASDADCLAASLALAEMLAELAR